MERMRSLLRFEAKSMLRFNNGYISVSNEPRNNSNLTSPIQTPIHHSLHRHRLIHPNVHRQRHDLEPREQSPKKLREDLDPIHDEFMRRMNEIQQQIESLRTQQQQVRTQQPPPPTSPCVHVQQPPQCAHHVQQLTSPVPSSTAPSLAAPQALPSAAFTSFGTTPTIPQASAHMHAGPHLHSHPSGVFYCDQPHEALPISNLNPYPISHSFARLPSYGYFT